MICGLLQLVHTRTADGFMSRYRVQVQNAVARLITGVRRCEHITPALHQLHWLPVRRQVNFKISTLISFLGTTPVYLPDEWMLVMPLAAILCGLLTIEYARSRDHATSSVTAVLPLPGQHCGTACLNTFRNRISLSDNSKNC